MDGEELDEEATPTVAAIPKLVARVGVVAAGATALLVAVFADRDLLELVGAAILVFIGLVAAIALAAYVLVTGRFPPRIGRGGTDLPARPVAASLDDLATTGEELADDVQELVETIQEHEDRLLAIEKRLSDE